MDVEETFDLYFSRFFGLYFAKIGAKLGWTPTFVSILSLAIGVVAGGLFYFQSDTGTIILACLLLTLAGILDSSDGQLARMTNQSSELGRSIDGTIDNFVFGAVYIAGSWYFLDSYGFSIIPLALGAALAHSYKTATYDFYKMEYMWLVGESKSSKILPLSVLANKMKNASGFMDKFLYAILWNHANQQFLISTRTEYIRSRFEQAAYELSETERSEFIKRYRTVNKTMLTWWAIFCGTNTHRTLMMVCALFARFDIYLVLSLVTFLPMLIVNLVQKNRDNQLLKTLGPKLATT